MIRLFISDLDGTLLTDEKKVNTADRIALEKLKHAGVTICLATGRNSAEIEDVLQELAISSHQVSQNGAQVHTDDGQILYSGKFDSEVALGLYQFIESLHLPVQVIIDAILTDGHKIEAKRIIPSEQKSFFSKEDNEIFQHMDKIDKRIGSYIQPTKFSYFGDITLLNQMANEVHKHFPNQFNSFIVDKDCLDFMPLQVSKGFGLKILFQHLGLFPDEVVCIGDSENDISMFELISNSFAMNTASSHVQSKASHIVKSVAEAVEWTISHNEKYSIRS